MTKKQAHQNITGFFLSRIDVIIFKFFSYNSTQQALQVGREHYFDWVLMDICMPDINGMTAILQWCHDPEIKDNRCMMMGSCANTASENKIQCKKIGLDHYLIQSVTLVQRVDAISQATDYQLRRNITLQEPNEQFSFCQLFLLND